MTLRPYLVDPIQLEFSTNCILRPSRSIIMTTLDKTPTELFQWLLNVHNDLKLKNFSEAESEMFSSWNVQVPAPASNVESGINKTKEFFEKYDAVISPLSGIHSTAAIVIGVLKFILVVSHCSCSKVCQVMIPLICLRLGARRPVSLKVCPTIDLSI